jgi:hypothetical protein
MLMVVAIICIITLVLFVRQQAFDSSTLLRSLAYSVALSFEQAQTYDVGVRGFTSSGSAATQFASGYGVYFSSGSATSYLTFADLNDDHLRASNGSEDLPAYLLSNTYHLLDVCGIWSSDSTVRSCLFSPQNGGSTLSWIEVYFKRPDPDAYFYSSVSGESYSAVYVELSSIGDTADVRTVKVTPTGEIEVCALNADPGSC